MQEAKHDVITVRVEPVLDGQLLQIAKERAKPKSEIVRQAIAEYIRKETEYDEIKKFLAKKYAEGRISFDNLVRFLGYNEAQKVSC